MRAGEERERKGEVDRHPFRERKIRTFYSLKAGFLNLLKASTQVL
jgi:hypothetical protein